VKNDVLMTGDVYRSVGFPNIDRTSGGSLKGMLDAFDTLIAAAGPNTKVLPDHGPITNRAGIIAHRRMAVALRDEVAKITNKYEKQAGNAPGGTGDRFVGQLFAELKASS
jgi:cyclase